MNNRTVGLAIMMASTGFQVGLAVSSGRPELWAVLTGLLALLAGSMILTSEWIPEVMHRRRLDKRMERRAIASLYRPQSSLYRTRPDRW